MRFSPLKNDRHLEILLIGIAIALGALHAWAGRFAMNPDGISYLDMGDAFWRGDWAMAFNTYWSPLYALLLGLALFLTQPTPYWEFVVVHGVNFFIYLTALFAFAFFLRMLHVSFFKGNSEATPLPAWIIMSIGYSLFLIASLHFITLAVVTPDLLVATFVFLITGVLLRISQGDMRLRNTLLLGVLLAGGYWTKAPLFPLAFVFLASLFFSQRKKKFFLPHIVLTGIIFFILSAPLFIIFSRMKGRLTFGESSRLTYAWHVNQSAPHVFWQGGEARYGTPHHPPRKIFDKPAVYEFGEPIGGTYPLWYDPTYWHEGIKTPFDLRGHARALLSNARIFYEMSIVSQLSSVLMGLLVLLLAARFRPDSRVWWILLVPSLIAGSMYAFVLIQSRYIAPFVVIGMLGLFSGIRFSQSSFSSVTVKAVAIAMIVMMAIPLTISTIKKFQPSLHDQWRIAAFLLQRGLARGDRVALIGHRFDGAAAAWARLARVKIIAENPPAGAHNFFWFVEQQTRSEVVEIFRRTGARVMVAEGVPAWAAVEGWERIGDTDHYVYWLTP